MQPTTEPQFLCLSPAVVGLRKGYAFHFFTRKRGGGPRKKHFALHCYNKLPMFLIAWHSSPLVILLQRVILTQMTVKNVVRG